MVTFAEALQKFVDDDYRKELGQVVVQWGLLEAMVECCIWQVAGLRNDVGRAMTAQTMMQYRVDTLGAVLNQTHPNLAAPFGKVARYIQDCLIGQRNKVIHSTWVQVPNGPANLAIATKFSARGKLVDQGGWVDIEILKKLSQDIADVTVWMHGLSSALPKLIERPDGLGLQSPDIQTRPDCAIRKQQALHPLPPPAKAPDQE